MATSRKRSVRGYVSLAESGFPAVTARLYL